MITKIKNEDWQKFFVNEAKKLGREVAGN